MKIYFRKIFNNFRNKQEKIRYYKLMEYKEEIKKLRKINEDLKEVNHQLLDLITLKNIKIRDLDLTNKLDNRR